MFSTSIAALKGVSWQNVQSKPIFEAACCLYITLRNSSITSTVIHGEIHGLQLKRRACLVPGASGQLKGLQVFVIKPLHSLESWFTKYRSQGKGKVTLGNQGSFSVTFPLSHFFFRFIKSASTIFYRVDKINKL